MTSGVVAEIAAATAGRDRVLDAVKAAALAAVVVGHSLAWHIGPTGAPVNVLDLATGLTPLTWLFQVLPLFFAAGAVSNAASLARSTSSQFTTRRTRRLGTPVVVYSAFWTVLLTIATAVVVLAGGQDGPIVDAGRFLSQLLWFAGVYTLVVAATPLTARWRSRPFLALTLWAGCVAAVDAARAAGAPEALGWLNFLLVWGWLGQLGYQLPTLRQVNKAVVGSVGLLLVAAAASVAYLGPYSMSLVTVSGDDELSNLAPPSMVLLLYGGGQVLLLAALWPLLDKLLSSDRLWALVAVFGARAMGVYLWHIPLVGIAALVAMSLDWQVAPLSAPWWLVHLAVVVVVLPTAWYIAGLAGRAERLAGHTRRFFRMPPTVAALGMAITVLVISTAGFATLYGGGLFGLPTSALINFVLLVLFWQAVGPVRSRTDPLESSR
ncbi:MAG: acyltransferase family protein [Actinobacteria bacterium]|nr:acyltransferase family protein [Actinomycetota bacterium]